MHCVTRVRDLSTPLPSVGSTVEPPEAHRYPTPTCDINPKSTQAVPSYYYWKNSAQIHSEFQPSPNCVFFRRTFLFSPVHNHAVQPRGRGSVLLQHAKRAVRIRRGVRLDPPYASPQTSAKRKRTWKAPLNNLCLV